MISGFEPLDVLQSILWILRQIEAGEAKVENQYKRVVPQEGNLRALEALAEVFVLRPHFEWRGLGFISQSALALSEAYADFDAERRFAVPGVRVADPKACQCGEVLKGVIKPWECKVFGTACTPEHAIGTCMVSPEGACAAYYNYGRFAREQCRRHRSEERILGIIETARAKRPRFKDPAITMAHGAGGKATQTLIEGLFVARLRDDRARAMADAGAAGDMVMTTDSFVVKPLRFPGGSIGELAVNGTVNDLAVAGARPLALTLAMILEEGLDSDVLRAEVEAIARTATAGRRRDRGRRHQGRRARARRSDVPGHDRRRASRTRARASARSVLRPGDRILLSGSIGEHGTAIMLARGEFELEADVESDTRSLWPAADALLEAAGPGLRCMRDATRGGVASVLNELARASSVAMVGARGRGARRPGGGRARRRSWGSIRCTWPTRASSSPSWPRSSRTRRWPRCARVDDCEKAAEIGEVRTEPPGMVLVETSFGGRRVMDQLVGDPLPRIC